MARKEIGIPLDRENRNNHNDNYKELFGVVNNIVGTITDEVYEKIIDGSKLNWKDPVESQDDLPSAGVEGDTRMTRNNGKVYRYDGAQWQEIQQIDAGPVNEVDRRLSSQLADEASQRITNEKGIYGGFYDECVVSFVFDDGSLLDYTHIKPIFEDAGVPANVAITTNWVGPESPYTSMTWEQIGELKALGWSVVSHGVNHKRPADMTSEEQIFELEESSRVLRERGFDHDIIVYPFGDVTNGFLKRARKFYKMGINVVIPSILSNEPPYLDNLNMVRTSMLGHSSGDNPPPTLSEIKNKIDEGIEKGKCIIFEDHASDIMKDPSRLEDLTELLQYIKGKDVPIVNLQDMYKMKCNIINTSTDSGKFMVHRNGKVSSDSFAFVKGTMSGGSQIDLPPEKYEENKITIERISNASDFPYFNVDTIRYTVKPTVAPLSWYQSVVNRRGEYVRWVDVENMEWGSWNKKPSFYKKTYTTTEQTIQAKKHYNYTIEDDTFDEVDKVFVATPKGELEYNILYTCYIKDSGRAVIRLTNMGESNVTVNEREWNITAI